MTLVPWWCIFLYATGCHTYIYRNGGGGGGSWNGYEFHTYPHPAKRPAAPRDVMVDVINNLGLKLLAIHNEYNENNIAISPYGAVSVLVALGEGVEGEAVYEIQQAAHLPNDISTIRVGLRDINRHLKSYFIPKEGFLAGLTLNHENVTLRQEYEDILKFYGYDTVSFNSNLFPEPETTVRPPTTSRSQATTANPSEMGTTKPEDLPTTETTPRFTTEPITTEKMTTTTEVEKPVTTLTPETTTNEITTEQKVTTAPPTSTSTTLPETTITELVTMEPKTIEITTINIPTTTRLTTTEVTTTEKASTTPVQTTPETTTTEVVTTPPSIPEETTTSSRTTTDIPTTTVLSTTAALSTTSTSEEMTSTSTNIGEDGTTTQNTLTTLIETTSASTTTSTQNVLTTLLPDTSSLPPITSTLLTTEETTANEDLLTLPTTETVLLDPTETTSSVDTTVSEIIPTTESTIIPSTGISTLTDITTTEISEISTAKDSKDNEIDTTDASMENTGFGGTSKREASKFNNVVELNMRQGMQHSQYSKRNSRSVFDYLIARYYDDHYVPRRRHYRPYIPPERPSFLIYGKYREYDINFMKYDTVLPFYYVPHLNALALSFPLDSTKYYLLLLLPVDDTGVDKLICDLRLNGSLKYIIANLRQTRVVATIPSFMLKGYVTLTPSFQKLGIRKVFEPRQADFTPMTSQRHIYVTNIEQAITVTIRNYVDPDSIHNYRNLHQYDPVHFKADHPFLYFVIDTDIHVTLMAGKIVNPLNSRIS